MTCKPYNPSTGDFTRTSFEKTPSAPRWRVKLENGTIQLEKDGVNFGTLTIRDSQTVGCLFFPSQNFLAVTDCVSVPGSPDSHKVWICDLRASELTVNTVGPFDLPLTSTGGHLQFNLHVSPDGFAFFIFAGGLMPNKTTMHKVYRTDTMEILLGWGDIEGMFIRLAKIEIISGRKMVRIKTGHPDSYQDAVLPFVKCTILIEGISKTIAQFKDVVLEGPESTIQSMPFTIKNDGTDDCLQIGSCKFDVIDSLFNVSGLPVFPYYIKKGMQINGILKFTPTLPGSFNNTLTIELPDMEEKKRQITCKGNAHMSNAECEIIPKNQVFNVVFGKINSAESIYTIKNTGPSDSLKVDSIKDSENFKLAKSSDYKHLLGPKASMSVTVEYKPKAVTSKESQEILEVASIPPNGDKTINCTGTARYPIVDFSAEFTQSSSFTTYRNRLNRVEIELKNTGEVNITMDVTSKSALFQKFNIYNEKGEVVKYNTISSHTTYKLKVDVMSDDFGVFPVDLKIIGTYILDVNDEKQNNLIHEVFKPECNLVANITVTSMEYDFFDMPPISNDTFDTATPIDLPPTDWNQSAVEDVKPALTIDDQNGRTDMDYFLVSYHPPETNPYEKFCDGIYKLHGFEMEVHRSSDHLEINTNTEETDDNVPFSRKLEIFSSDKNCIESTNGRFYIENPSVKFPDNKLYVVMSNPEYTSQGPIQYDIKFSYKPPVCTISTTGLPLTRVQYLKLKKYYDKVWLVNPPRDLAGDPVYVREWIHGEAIVIPDVKSFIKEHLEVVSNSDIFEGLNEKTDAILASEFMSLAHLAKASGLPVEAEELYRKSVSKSSHIQRPDLQAEALRGQIGFYLSEKKFAKANIARKSLAAVLTKSQRKDESASESGQL